MQEQRGADADVERHAYKKSIRRVAKRLRQGWAPRPALYVGHRRYKKLGGQATYSEWIRKVTGRK